MKKIVKGNDITLKIPVMKMVEGQAKDFPLPACTDVVVQVCNQFKRIPLAFEIDVKEDNVLLARVEGDKMSLGTYAIEVKGKIFGNDWRSNEYPQFAIVSNNADADTEFGETDEGDNSVEMDTAMVILPPSVELSDLISDTNEALGKVDGAISKTDEAIKKANDAVSQVNGALEKVQNVDIDIDGTDLNITRPSGEKKEFDLMQLKGDKGERGEKGDKGLQGEQGIQGVKGDPFTYDDFTEAEIKELQKPATEAATKAQEIFKKAETATTGAETCNVTMKGSTISVTNRHGETKSVDVINTDEEVTVTIASSVNSIKVTGIKINVFLNNGKTPQTYTTDAEGKATFTIDRGNYYQVVFPEYGNAQPIAPQGYTAVLGSRSINVEYLPYDEDTSEKVIVNVQKCGNDNECAAWEGMPVTITFDGKDSVVNTDSNGQVVAFVPFGKEYTVKVEDKDGYNVSYNRNVRTFKAEMPKRIVAYKLYKFRAGVLIIDANRNEYYLDEWIAAGRNADDAVAIKIADANLAINNSAFCIKTADMKNTAQLKRKAWCVQNMLFNSIVSTGDEMKDENYYRGNTSSYLVRQEAQERSLIVPAFDYAYSTTLVLGGEELRGFIMSIGQENAHVANIESIKEILTSLFSADIAATYYNFVKHNKRWTSAQNGNMSAYYYFSKQEGFNLKQIENFVLPAYPC